MFQTFLFLNMRSYILIFITAKLNILEATVRRQIPLRKSNKSLNSFCHNIIRKYHAILS